MCDGVVRGPVYTQSAVVKNVCARGRISLVAAAVAVARPLLPVGARFVLGGRTTTIMATRRRPTAAVWRGSRRWRWRRRLEGVFIDQGAAAGLERVQCVVRSRAAVCPRVSVPVCACTLRRRWLARACAPGFRVCVYTLLLYIYNIVLRFMCVCARMWVRRPFRAPSLYAR